MYPTAFSTVVSEEDGTLICELIMERYIYLRNNQQQLKNTDYGRSEFFLEIHSVYNGICLKLLGSLLYKLGDFASLYVKIEGWFCIITFDISTNFYSVFVDVSYTIKISLIYWLHSEIDRSPGSTLSKNVDIIWEMTPFTTF